MAADEFPTFRDKSYVPPFMRQDAEEVGKAGEAEAGDQAPEAQGQPATGTAEAVSRVGLEVLSMMIGQSIQNPDASPPQPPLMRPAEQAKTTKPTPAQKQVNDAVQSWAGNVPRLALSAPAELTRSPAHKDLAQFRAKSEKRASRLFTPRGVQKWTKTGRAATAFAELSQKVTSSPTGQIHKLKAGLRQLVGQHTDSNGRLQLAAQAKEFMNNNPGIARDPELRVLVMALSEADKVTFSDAGEIVGIKGDVDIHAPTLQGIMDDMVTMMEDASPGEQQQLTGAMGEALKLLLKSSRADVSTHMKLADRVEDLASLSRQEPTKENHGHRMALATLDRQMRSAHVVLDRSAWIAEASDVERSPFNRLEIVDVVRQADIDFPSDEKMGKAHEREVTEIRNQLLNQVADQSLQFSSQEYLKIDTTQFHDKYEADPGRTGSLAQVVNGSASRLTAASLSIADEILHAQTPDERARVIEKYIDLSGAMADKGAFPDVIGVFSGLIASPVGRLKQSWDLISPEHQQKWKDLRELADPRGMFKQIQERCKNDPKGVVPLPVTANQVTFVLENEPGKAGELPEAIQDLEGKAKEWFNGLRSKVFEAFVAVKNENPGLDDTSLWKLVDQHLEKSYKEEVGVEVLPYQFFEAVEGAVGGGEQFMAAMAVIVSPIRDRQAVIGESLSEGADATLVDPFDDKGTTLMQGLGVVGEDKDVIQKAFNKHADALSLALEPRK